jgi:hypothetical protein
MYYLLSSSSRPRRQLGRGQFIKGLNWWRGAVITMSVPDPLEYTLDIYHPTSPDEDQYMGVFIETNPPIWRDDFIQALRNCGVYNFDTYNVAITNPDNTAFVQEVYQDLRDNGITDIDAYLRKMGVIDPATWIDPNPGVIYTHYKAVNILGLVAAADMSKSVATVHDGIPLIDVDFDELVIDEKKTNGIKMFRLAESTNAILVHESLRDALIAKGFGSDLAFYDLKEAAI